MYERRRNIVYRDDGRRVNVARSRGQLFVCADGCCCGRTEDGFAPVPTALYHQEWERRRLRNIVHLTQGGCLGPCALANVALLLFDGQALWFHTLNTPELVTGLYDYIVAMLDADRLLPAPDLLAAHQFTATTWQPRPDGAPVDDHRHWQTRRGHRTGIPRSPADWQATVDDRSGSGAVPAAVSGGQPSSVVADGSGSPPFVVPGGRGHELPDGCDPEALAAALRDAVAAPRRNGELVFAAPWEGRAFGLAVALHDQGHFTWDEFRDHLIAAIGAAEAAGGTFVYYECWTAALEAILREKAMLTATDLEERTSEFEFGERDEVF